MKYSVTAIILVFFLSTAFAQEKIAGQYALKTSGDSSDILRNVVLTLHCNNSFVNKDSFATGYGKWYLKENNQLSIEFDSIIYNHNDKPAILKTKILYLVENGRIYRKVIPEKEYKKFLKDIKEVLKSNRFFKNAPLESFQVYEEKALKMYYEQTESYSCP